MSYYIFGKIENQIVTFVGCIRTADIPADSIFLQTVEHHPEVHWIKWSVRFRRTLTDKRALDHPYARYFKNPARLARMFGDKDFERLCTDENAQFLQCHQKRPELLDKLIERALAEKTAGRTEFSLGQLLGDARWRDSELDQGSERFRVDDRWSAWYSRVLQMVEPELVGFFRIRSGVADALVWIDGRTWQQFASENAEEIRWSDPFDEFPDSEWEFRAW